MGAPVLDTISAKCQGTRCLRLESSVWASVKARDRGHVCLQVAMVADLNSNGVQNQ